MNNGKAVGSVEGKEKEKKGKKRKRKEEEYNMEEPMVHLEKNNSDRPTSIQVLLIN